MTIQKKIVSCALFILIYMLPIYISFKKKGIVFSGNSNLENSQKLETLNEILIFSNDFFLKSLDLSQNGIFIFFISAIIYKTIIDIL